MDDVKTPLISENNSPYAPPKDNTCKYCKLVILAIAIILGVISLILVICLRHETQNNNSNYLYKLILFNNCSRSVYPYIIYSNYTNNTGLIFPGKSYTLYGSDKIDIVALDDGITYHPNMPLTKAHIYTINHNVLYHVTMVSGYNIPISLELVNNTQCQKIYWNYPITENICPFEYRYYVDKTYIGCQTPCQVYKLGQYCCSGNYSCAVPQCVGKYCFPIVCLGQSWPGNSSSIFGNACPFCTLTKCLNTDCCSMIYGMEIPTQCGTFDDIVYKLTFC
ncbi:MAG: pathogenesis-related protein 5-like [Satyrvirus sp.]|uniref:Pathogenesis-related protein 5-like n=1 Tax=Satyrvirus sp. TaxID=2487771 RepID=A0A3G5AEJ5_9VIRU|nr:MAG: pathogenesis-related protein 5-like [Satyrvirus sp.]